jgi:hypothetical protein
MTSIPKHHGTSVRTLDAETDFGKILVNVNGHVVPLFALGTPGEPFLEDLVNTMEHNLPNFFVEDDFWRTWETRLCLKEKKKENTSPTIPLERRHEPNSPS